MLIWCRRHGWSKRGGLARPICPVCETEMNDHETMEEVVADARFDMAEEQRHEQEAFGEEVKP